VILHAGAISWGYWIGLEKVLRDKTHAYYLSDGTYIGNGFTSNASPYAHYGYQYQDQLTGYQNTRNCTLAHSSWAYDQVCCWRADTRQWLRQGLVPQLPGQVASMTVFASVG
jgi:hypothetical protein